MSRHIKKTKFLFTLASLFLVGVMTLGVAFFQRVNLGFNVYAPKHLAYRFEYAKEITDNMADRLKITWNGLPSDTGQEGTEAISIPIFVYHGIVKDADRFSMTHATFKEQMFALKRNGYQTVTTEEIADFIHRDIPLPEKSFLLTFDDGRRDSYFGADPILRALDYTAVMYVAVESSAPSSGLNPTYYLSAKEIRHMADTGRWEIGSHAIQEKGGYVYVSEDGAVGNFLSSREWLREEGRLETNEEYLARMEREIVTSKQIIEEKFGVDASTFSYPFGDYGQQTENTPEAVGIINSLIRETYQLAFRQTWEANNEFAFNYADTDPYELKRIEPPTDWSGEELIAYLETHNDIALPFEDTFITNSGWRGSWGNTEIREGQLILKATGKTTGAATFFHGSKTWKNYLFNAEIAQASDSHISLMTQYVNANDYLVCTFGNGNVKIEHVLNDVPTLLAEAESIDAYAGKNTLGVRAANGSIDCFINNNKVASAPTEMKEGGIGMRIWREGVGTANMYVDTISVVPVPTE